MMDTNVLISAMFYPDSKPAKALCHAADNGKQRITAGSGW